jgi:hypothetical protein
MGGPFCATLVAMGAWVNVEHVAPELAVSVRGRFEAYGLALLATLRRDGSPRISGIEVLFALDELWMGMMPGSLKALDLMRDGRFALHSATTDKQVTNGDARISGVVIHVDDEAMLARYRDVFAAATGYPPPDGPFELFRADVTEISMLKPAGDHLDIEFWSERGGLKHVDRL